VSLRDTLAADLKNVIFNTEDFAEVATYTPKVGTAKKVNGIFRENLAEEIVVGIHAKVEASAPNFQCSQVDIPTTTDGDRLLIRGINYYVLNSKLKSNTTIVLHLSTDKP
jgi:hypothetical protein